MKILDRWTESHHEIHNKISLLEKALISFLDNASSDKIKEDLQKKLGFLETFESGMQMHFTIEEKALFPEVIKAGSSAQALVDELMTEHGIILGKIHMAMQTSRSLDDRVAILKKVLNQIDAHAKNEDKNVSRIINQMKPDQIKNIERAYQELGYSL